MAKSSPKLPRVFNKRVGPLTKDEKGLVYQFLADQPHEVRSEDIKLLARLMHRQPNTIRLCITLARQNFASNALRYVEIHREATEKALAAGDYDTAAKACQWAMENISLEGERIVDKYTSANVAPKVYVGVCFGGMRVPSDATNAEPSE
jgi:hypothetical protein